MAKLSRSLIALVGFVCAMSVSAQSVELRNRSEPLPGITASGQPDQKALEALADQGYVAVIDLRGTEEDRGFDERGTVEGLGMSYVTLPVSGNDLNYEDASALDRIIADIDGPVLLHCASSNRVGAMLALRARQGGATTEQALELGEAAGLTSLRTVVEEKLVEADAH